jgi:hypothetical protein
MRSRIENCRRISAAGLTLLETLVAISVIMIVSISLLATIATLNRIAGGARQRGSAEDRLRLLQSIADELGCAVPVAVGKRPVFSIGGTKDENARLALEFAIYDSALDDVADSTARLVIRRYDLEQGVNGEFVLKRRTRAVRGPGSLATGLVETVAVGLSSFQARALSGSEWRDQWPPDGESELPEAVELSLAVTADAAVLTNSVIVYIPAGNVVTSSFERSSAPVE